MTDFEALYRERPDPWQTRTSWYERRKREVLLASLPRETYEHALELGAGTGELTERLAQRCTRVTAVDLSETAMARNRAYLTQHGAHNVHTMVMRVPSCWPLTAPGQADLVVVSELGYYLEDDALERLINRCLHALADHGDWVMCHYLPDFHDRLQDTFALHQRVCTCPSLTHLTHHLDERFQLDIWRKQQRGDP